MTWLRGPLLTGVLVVTSLVTATPAHADFISANSTRWAIGRRWPTPRAEPGLPA
ncbi:hypothetical protein AB0L53_24225 [Nonomuraea sp. NPDC052129]|uniref:hypothetical protein n=1 Tax=Nonomuraea sp. NPDC052129 TaxID=3154651 RepID=UPI00342C45C5